MTEQHTDFAINAQQVADYLAQHPTFFSQYTDLLDHLQIPHQRKGAVSLVELQLDRQREKIEQLQQELAKLTQIAQHNEQMFFSLMPLQQKLFTLESVPELTQALQHWAENLGLKQVKVLLFNDAWHLPTSLPAEFQLDRRAFEVIRLERFGLRSFYLGKLTHKEKTLLFLPEEFPVGSVALCLLKDNKQPQSTTGLLLFSSHNEGHFYAKQETAFLQELTRLIESQLTRILTKQE